MADPTDRFVGRAPGSWAPLLDDLERRVVAAEAGDMRALEGWEAPAGEPQPMTAQDQRRAQDILARQHVLLGRLRDEQRAVATSIRATRRARAASPASVPVYIDRLG